MLPHYHTKIFISCTTPISAKHLFSYSTFSNLSTFTQYMSVSHGHSTMGGIEVVVEKTKKEGDSLTSTRRFNGLWRCPSIDINVSE